MRMYQSGNTSVNIKLRDFIVLIAFLAMFILGCNSNKQEVLSQVGSYEITVDDFKERYSNYLFSTGIKDNIVNRRDILNNMIDELSLLKYDDVFGARTKKKSNCARRRRIYL